LTRRANFGDGTVRSGRAVRRVRHLPQDDSDCGWIAALPPLPPARRLAGEQSADCAVVGAGFTGLAVARRLAELRPSWRIAVVDAQRAGFGASARSSGFVVDLAHFIARMDFAASRRYVGLCRLGIAQLREAARAHAIACDWDEAGWLHVAAGEAAARDLPGLRAWLDRLGEPYSWLERGELAALLGTPFYRVGVRLPGSVLVQPAALVRGLAGSLPGNVDLFEESPVRTISRGRTRGRAGRFEIQAEGGRISADRLFVAANGYSPALGVLRDRVFPLLTFGSMTRPLTPDEQQALGGEREWGLLAEDPMGSTLRRTRDQRILVRNTVRYDPRFAAGRAFRERVRTVHRRSFLARFPGLAAVDFAHTWGGVMGASPNRGHSFGEVEKNLFTAAGYTGAGIAMGTTAGRLLADLALGEDSAELSDMLALPAPAWLPPQPFLEIGARWRVARLNASAGATL
jgi:glycine/D-amino acid oxidase-like deaminating enzyme